MIQPKTARAARGAVQAPAARAGAPLREAAQSRRLHVVGPARPEPPCAEHGRAGGHVVSAQVCDRQVCADARQGAFDRLAAAQGADRHDAPQWHQRSALGAGSHASAEREATRPAVARNVRGTSALTSTHSRLSLTISHVQGGSSDQEHAEPTHARHDEARQRHVAGGLQDYDH